MKYVETLQSQSGKSAVKHFSVDVMKKLEAGLFIKKKYLYKPKRLLCLVLFHLLML